MNYKTVEKIELTRVPESSMIFYDFKAGLNKDECVQGLQLASVDESPCRSTVFRWFKKFCIDRGNSLQHEEHTGRSRSAVIPDNVFAIRKMLMDDNHCTYQMIDGTEFWARSHIQNYS
ncbi:uncharacterized protein TNCV_2514141 [Trichonephila clavipes]|nr:uncharacterized protein TNCV_2514141 [Trichonephila clavipes]